MGWIKVDKSATRTLDHEALGQLVALKALADDAWPAAASLPRWASDAVLVKLGAWLDVDGDSFRCADLDADHAEADAKRAGDRDRKARQRQRSKGVTRDVPREVTRDVTVEVTALDKDVDVDARGAKAPLAQRAREGDDFARIARLVEAQTSVPYAVANPHSKWGEKLAGWIARHGVEAVDHALVEASRQIKAATGKPPDVRQLIFAAGDLLDPIVKVEAAKPEPLPRKRSSVLDEPWRKQYAAAQDAYYRKEEPDGPTDEPSGSRRPH